MNRPFCLGCLGLVLVLSWTAAARPEIPAIERRLPPTDGVTIPAATRTELTARLAAVQRRLDGLAKHPLHADVAALSKAVDYALRHNEFYSAGEIPRASFVLDEATRRLDELEAGSSSWTKKAGLVVRGFRSRVDGSPQPYGLEIPTDLDRQSPAPLYVWLHGRGDKQTDLHFIYQRMKQAGKVVPPGAMVVHPFGRQCLGFKSAGETDVLEAVEHVCSQYNIDQDRIVLMGFSMGGAGAWHLGAHYTDRWVAVSPGAGFAETAQYNRLTPDSYPPRYEQTLWGVYDVPDYVRNLFNVPVIAYSGENDRQIQAARVMEAAFAEHQQTLPHLIGPGMGHAYHPETLAELLRRMDAAVKAGRPQHRKQVHLQTRTLRYWVQLLGLEQHWLDSRADAEFTGPKQLRVTTRNVRRMRLNPLEDHRGLTLQIDGQALTIPTSNEPLTQLVLRKNDQQWQLETGDDGPVGLWKVPGLQGPIDDAFLDTFLVVTPGGKSKNARLQAWLDFELEHLRDRWRAVFRGELPEKTDQQVTDQDLAACHLVVWGDPDSNAVLRRMLAHGVDTLPLRWDAQRLQVGERSFDPAANVPVFVYPNSLHPSRYVVCNSGPTFREGHDRTNSLQNPKLPDWAVLDITQLPNEMSAGKVVEAGFFDERWQYQAP